jgi:hypothetical protein
MAEPTEEYLGDGLYVSFDGWHFELRAPRDNGNHTVYLESGRGGTLDAFLAYVQRERARLQLADASNKVLGDFRQGLIRKVEAITKMRELGHDDAETIVDEWLSELEWEEIAQDYRRAAHD